MSSLQDRIKKWQQGGAVPSASSSAPASSFVNPKPLASHFSSSAASSSSSRRIPAPPASSSSAKSQIPIPPQASGKSGKTSSVPSNLRPIVPPSSSSSSSSSGSSSLPVAADSHKPSSETFLGLCRPVTELEKLQEIGQGTYGTVYLARDKETGDLVALKKFKLDIEREGMPITTLREIKMLKSLRHPNIVQLKEIMVGYKLSSIFLVFEYAEHDLGDLLDTMKTRFSDSEVKSILQQLLKAVAFLHSKFVIHRDLKLPNMLYNQRGEIKLCDFGLARPYGDPITKSYTPNVVTIWYRAPELLLGAEKYSTAIDIWSVGCIFGELLLHTPLLPGKTEMEQIGLIFDLLGAPNERIWPDFASLPVVAKQLSKAAQNPYSNLRRRFDRLSASGYDLLSRMLTYDPNKRITAEEALRHPFFSEMPLPKEPAYMPSFPSRHGPVPAAPLPPLHRKREIAKDGEEQGRKKSKNEKQ